MRGEGQLATNTKLNQRHERGQPEAPAFSQAKCRQGTLTALLHLLHRGAWSSGCPESFHAKNPCVQWIPSAIVESIVVKTNAEFMGFVSCALAFIVFMVFVAFIAGERFIFEHRKARPATVRGRTIYTQLLITDNAPSSKLDGI